VTAISVIGASPVPANHLLGRKLDSIPFSPYHMLIIGVLGLIGFVEGYDLSMTASLLVLAKHPLHLTETDIRFVAVASTMMACVGGFIASAMSDHWSRKLVMQIGVITTTFFTLLIPLVQTAEQLIIVRLLTGLGGGFAVSAAFPIAAEPMPAAHRRTYGAVYEMSLAASFTTVFLVSFLLADNPNAFRLMALPGGLMVFIAPVLLHFVIPESPRWHLRRSRVEAAVEAVNQIILRAGSRVPPLSVETLANDFETTREQLPPYWALFRPGQLRWTVVGILSGVCAAFAAFLIHVLLPKALVDQGAAVSLSFGLATHLCGEHPRQGIHRVPDGDHWTALDNFLCPRGIIAGSRSDADGAPGRSQRGDRDDGGRADHRLHRALGLYRHPCLSVRAIPHGAAGTRAYFR